MWRVALPVPTAILGKVSNLPKVVARVPHRSELLWWPSCHLLLWCRGSAVVPLLDLWAVAPGLWRMVRLSRGLHVDHAVLRGSTARTTSGGSWHGPLLLLLLRRFTGPLGVLLVNGGSRQLIV
jgi:hypothetical protein